MRGKRHTWVWQGSGVIIIGFVLATLVRDPGAWWVGLGLGILVVLGMAIAAMAQPQAGDGSYNAPSSDNEPIPLQVGSTDRASKRRVR